MNPLHPQAAGEAAVLKNSVRVSMTKTRRMTVFGLKMDLTSYNIASININTITSPTKLNALRNFVTNQWLDIVCLQEVENEQLTLPGYTVVCNVDHTRRGTAIALKPHISFSHVEKSLDGRLIALRVQDTTICSINAPSGASHRAAREQFFNGTLAY